MILLFLCKCKVLFYINNQLSILLTEFKGINHATNKIDLFQWLTTPLKHYEISVTFRNKFSHNNFKMYSLSDRRLTLKGDECEVDRHWNYRLPKYGNCIFEYCQFEDAKNDYLVRRQCDISSGRDNWTLQGRDGGQWQIYAINSVQYDLLQHSIMAEYEDENFLPWNRKRIGVLLIPFQMCIKGLPLR